MTQTSNPGDGEEVKMRKIWAEQGREYVGKADSGFDVISDMRHIQELKVSELKEMSTHLRILAMSKVF